MNQSKSKLDFNATWSMAVGGMVGGGIFSTLGVLTGAASSIALIVRLFATDPLALVFLGVLVLVALFGRPILLRHVKKEGHYR